MATKTVDVKATLEEIRRHADFTPETLEKAEEILGNARMQISGGASHLGSLVLDGCYQAWTTAVDTFAVTLAADGFPILMLNPNFAVDLTEPITREGSLSSAGITVLDDSGVVFVLLHEASHLLFKHLRRTEFQSELGTLATEATINYFVHGLLTKSGRTGAWSRTPRWMPSTPKLKADGTPAKDSAGNQARERSGVDPWKVYDGYRKDLKERGLDPVTIDTFYVSDSECLRQLQRMSTPPKQPPQPCEHMAGSGDNTESGGSSQDSPDTQDTPATGGSAVNVELDQAAVDEAMDEVLRSAITKALREGSESDLRKELLALEAITPEASTRWGDLGIGSLRGETAKTRKVDWWVQWLSNQIASRVQESDRLVHDRSIVWETRLGWVGDDEKFNLLIALDTSASMPDHVIEEVSKLVGTSDQFDATWVCFDGDVWPFTPGEVMSGGGGTSFTIIDSYAETLEEDPDAVIVLTDGYAPHFTPRSPEKWVWLITEDGDLWPGTHDVPMSCYPIGVPHA